MGLAAPTPLPLDPNGRTVQNTYRNMASGNGTVTTSGTAVRLSNTSQEAKILDIVNPLSNGSLASGGTLVLGDSSVSYASLKGIPILPGFTYRMNVKDLSQVYVDASDNGATFSYNYFY